MSYGTKSAVNRPLNLTVKETVDFVYEYLAPHPEGIEMNARSLGLTQCRVVTILLKRGIVAKKAIRAPHRRGVVWIYKWAATMAPTKNLYGSVTDQLRDDSRRQHQNQKRGKAQKPEEPIQEPQPQDTIQVSIEGPKNEYVTTLDGFSAQELWDELKKRGYTIEDNRLVIVKKAYLD